MAEKITVVIPLFNKAPHIRRALDSVLAQTRLPDEVIVIDDGSTDGGGKLVENIDNCRFRLICQENQGESAARNRGIAAAKGDLIAFLDADDAWKPRFLEVICRLAQRFPQAGAYGTAWQTVTSQRAWARDFKVLLQGENEGLIENYYKVALSFPIWTSALAVPKKVLKEIGGFPVGEKLSEDVDTWLRIALRYPIAWSREVCASYYLNASNRACQIHNFDKEPVVSRTARRLLSSGEVPPALREDLREYVSHFQIDAAREFLIQGNKKLAREMLAFARGTRIYARWWWKIRLLAELPDGMVPRLRKLQRHWWELKGRLR